MGWICLVASAERRQHYQLGFDPFPTVNKIPSAKACFCHECMSTSLIGHLSSPMCDACGLPISQSRSTSSLPASRARILAVQELAEAWKESAADWFSKSSASLTSSHLRSLFWKTFPQSERVADAVLERNWPAWGMIVDGVLYPRQKSERSTFVKDGSYLPTPTRSDYEKNTGRKSEGITASGRDRWSLTVRATRGELPGHPKGLLNPQWIEQAMGYPIDWTGIAHWATALFPSKRGQHSKS